MKLTLALLTLGLFVAHQWEWVLAGSALAALIAV